MHWLGAAACVPLMDKDRLIGFLVLGNKKSGGAYSREDKKFLSHVSEIVSSATSHILYGQSESIGGLV
jgi:GAF domain-containing protein